MEYDSTNIKYKKFFQSKIIFEENDNQNLGNVWRQ